MRLTALILFSAALALCQSAGALQRGQGDGSGEPGDGRGPIRIFEVTANEDAGAMGLEPASVAVNKGEQIKFVVHNAGALSHEFVIGTKAENAAHARMMEAMPDMEHDDPNAVTIAPGGSATLVWRFTNAGAFEFACLIPGHYEAGMHGVVTVK